MNPTDRDSNGRPIFFRENWNFGCQSLRYLNKHPSLWFIALIAKLCSWLAIAWVAHPLIDAIVHANATPGVVIHAYKTTLLHVSFYLILLALLYGNNVFGTLLHALSQAAVAQDLQGQGFSLSSLFRSRLRKIPSLFWWCLIRSTFNGPLHLFIFFLKFYRLFSQKLINGSWHITIYFSVISLYLDPITPVQAIGISRELLRKTWGDHVVSRVGRGFMMPALLIAALCVIGPSLILHWAGVARWGAYGMLTTIALIALLFATEIALSNIYCAALYVYAKTGKTASPFTPVALQCAFLPTYDE